MSKHGDLGIFRHVLGTPALLMIALLLTACGSNNNGANNKPASPIGGSATAAASATKPPSPITGASQGSPGPGGTPSIASSASAATGGGPTKNVKLGAALTLTGPNAQYGVSQKNAIQLASDEINSGNSVPGVHLDIVYEDDAGTPDQGLTVLQKFITQDKVSAIIGPTLSGTAASADRAAQMAMVPVLGVSNTAAGITDIGNFIFRDSLTEADVLPQTVAKSQAKLGYKTVAILYANDEVFSKSGYDSFKAALDKSGIKIVDTETFSKDDKDFSAQLSKVKDAKPDALIVSALIDPAVGIATQARKLGLSQPIIGGNGFNSPAYIKGAGDAAENTIVGAAWNSASTNPLSQKFITAYKAKFSADPDQFAAQAYAGVYILAQAINIANSTDRQAIRDALLKIKDFDTVLGTFNFTPARDAAHGAVVQVVKSGKFVPLDQ